MTDFSDVPLIDSAAAATMARFVRMARRHGALVCLFRVNQAIRTDFAMHGLTVPDVDFHGSLDKAMCAARRHNSQRTAA